jgi:hypothetical protein
MLLVIASRASAAFLGWQRWRCYNSSSKAQHRRATVSHLLGRRLARSCSDFTKSHFVNFAHAFSENILNQNEAENKI